MDQFTIRDIENLCGIKAHTLRIWEQRYKLFVARRKESQHRVYNNDDLKELLRISFLYHNGHKISRIAALDREQIHEMVQNSRLQDNNHEVYVHQLIEAGVDFDKERFEKIVNCLVMRIGLEKCITEVFYPFLERIGLLWMTNHVIPAQEHFVSHIIRKKIILATDGLDPAPADEVPVLVFAPAGEYHEIPLLVANYFFRKYKRKTIYFGTNVELCCLKEYLTGFPASMLYAHVVTYLDQQELDKYLHGLKTAFPEKQLVVSGPAIKYLRQPLQGIQLIYSLEEMIGLAKRVVNGS